MGDAVLAISGTLTLPLEAATETFGILGQKGSGKSTAAVVIAEEMWHAGIPWVAVDPKGDWWGIRSSSDGSKPGLPLPVFGGLHGDLPLEAGSGAYVADLIVDKNLTDVLDVSDFSKNERARFLVAFFDRLYQRHRTTPTVRHVFLEEAHEYIPQQVGREEGRLKEAAARLVLMGRTFGLGVTVCSQRSARIHKDVLTQIGTLIAMRTLAELDRKAIEGWVKEHNVARDLLASLSSLESGEAWVWSPQFLGRIERIRFRPRLTFDSGATPRLGAGARPPATLADVDLAEIKTSMAEAIERAAADDPKRLRQRITELERQTGGGTDESGPLHRQIAQLTADLTAARAEIRTIQVEVPALHEDDFARIDDALAALADAAKPIADALAQLRDRPAAAAEPVARTPVPARSVPASQPAVGGETKLALAETKILTVLAQHGPRTAQQIALLTGYSGKSGGFRNSLSSLRTAGRIGGQRGGLVEATPDGLAALGDWEPLPTGAGLVDWWNGQLGQAERRILGVLVATWPAAIPTGQVADLAGYSATSGGFRNACSRLRTLGLADGQRGELRAADELGDTR